MTAPSLTDIFDAVESVLAGAGAAVDPPIVQVVAGEPAALSNYPLVAYWYIGERPWDANTMSATQREVGFRIQAYWPGVVRAKAMNRALELAVATLARALYAGFLGHVELNGTATGKGLEVTDPMPGWSQVGDVIARSLTCELWVYLAAPDAIGA